MTASFDWADLDAEIENLVQEAKRAIDADDLLVRTDAADLREELEQLAVDRRRVIEAQPVSAEAALRAAGTIEAYDRQIARLRLRLRALEAVR